MHLKVVMALFMKVTVLDDTVLAGNLLLMF